MAGRLAVVLFNLGGPDRPESVRPFLFNLFNDPAIFRLPQPFRWLLAQFVAARRAPVARAIYAQLGGGSPLLELTLAQAAALQTALAGSAGVDEAKVFVAMRYWHPMSDEVARQVREWRPDEVVLLPLYPQFSTATTASSLAAWRTASAAAGLQAPCRAVCCYPEAEGMVGAHAALLAEQLARAEAAGGRVRVLFSAHGLPKKVVLGGDPYQWQIERTVEAVVRRLRLARGGRPFDFEICYQSRVGPLEWLGPATEGEVRRAGKEGVGIVMVPIAFVSEHSETLVEMDREYRELAVQNGVPSFERVPALGTHEAFVAELAALVRQARERPAGCLSAPGGGRICPSGFSGCPATAGGGI